MTLLRAALVVVLMAIAAMADVNVRACAPEPEVTAMAYGDLVNCELEVVGDNDLFRFTAQVGEKLYLVALRYNTNADPCFRIIEPDAAIGPYRCGRAAAVNSEFTVTKAGAHTVEVTDGSRDEAFRFGFAIFQMFPYTASMTPITAFGQVISATSTPRGDSDFYAFRGSNGDTISIVLARTATNADPCFRLIQPNGTIGGFSCGRAASVSADIRLTQSGSHIIHVVDGSIDETFNYNLNVQCIGACPNPDPRTTPPAPMPGRLISITPCRIADTRNATGPFGGPIMNNGETRTFDVSGSACGIPGTAKAYSLNATVVPSGPLSFLTMWPAGLPRPLVSTLNSFEGDVVANAAIVPAGTNSGINVFVTERTHVVLDINGYFVDPVASPQSLAFFPITPCRVSDTRNAAGPFGGPAISGGSSRDFAVRGSVCGLPSTAQAYSLNVTAVPTGALSFLTIYPAGQQRPLASTLNSFRGAVVANAAIVPAGTNGDVSVFVTDRSDVILDINGYFAPPAAGGLQFYSVTPCRISDTRNAVGSFGGPTLDGGTTRDVNPQLSACGIPATAQAYSTNVTVVPARPLSFLTLWPAAQTRPLVSTLNSFLGRVVANAAIVPSGANGAVSFFVTDRTDVVFDINGYFAP